MSETDEAPLRLEVEDGRATLWLAKHAATARPDNTPTMPVACAWPSPSAITATPSRAMIMAT